MRQEGHTGTDIDFSEAGHAEIWSSADELKIRYDTLQPATAFSLVECLKMYQHAVSRRLVLSKHNP
jgi:hypothetical protein